MATNVTISTGTDHDRSGRTTSDVVVQVYDGGAVTDNDTNVNGFDGVYFSAFRSIGSYYNVIVMSSDGTPFDIAKLIVADLGDTRDAIEVYAVDKNGNLSRMVYFETIFKDVSQSFSSQIVDLYYKGVFGIAIKYLNNSGGAFYFDSEAFAAVSVAPPPDTTAPTLSSSTPTDDATNVAAGANLILTFDEDVVAGTGNITIVNAANPNDSRVIAVTDSQVTISGNIVMIAPLTNFNAGDQYYVEIDAGAFEDAAGNKFAGITDPSELNFSVAAAASGGSDPDPPTGVPIVPVTPTTVYTDDSGRAVATNRAEHFVGKADAIDSVTFTGSRENYTVTRNTDGSYLIKGAGAADTLTSIERLYFDDGVLALDVDAVPGVAFRLYQAAFGRAPDEKGLGYWIGRLDDGEIDLLHVSKLFLQSPEFAKLYGSGDVEPAELITLLYRNILGRVPEDEGFSFWQEAVENDASYEWLLSVFSESAENRDNVAPSIADGIWYQV